MDSSCTIKLCFHAHPNVVSAELEIEKRLCKLDMDTCDSQNRKAFSMPVKSHFVITQVFMRVSNIWTVSFITRNICIIVHSNHMINETLGQNFNFVFAADCCTINFCFVPRLPLKWPSVCIEKLQVLFWKSKFFGNFDEFIRNDVSLLFLRLLCFFGMRFLW